MNKKMSKSKRVKIMRATRKYCTEHNIKGTELSRETGISAAACSKLLAAKGTCKSKTSDIRVITAEMLELWLQSKEPVEAAPTQLDWVETPTPVTDPKLASAWSQLTSLEADLLERDETILALRDTVGNMANTIEKLTRQRDKLLDVL